ncbi:MAG TPA: hypothetical protein PLF31_03455 [Candidatus Paceibacterota bacterium]|nr:hypothetical protein [Candidatus Paceibacterota bacterium]
MSDVQFDEVDFSAQSPLFTVNQKKGSGMGRMLAAIGIGVNEYQADRILVVFIVIAIISAVAIPVVSMYSNKLQANAPVKSTAETLMEIHAARIKTQ